MHLLECIRVILLRGTFCWPYNFQLVVLNAKSMISLYLWYILEGSVEFECRAIFFCPWGFKLIWMPKWPNVECSLFKPANYLQACTKNLPYIIGVVNQTISLCLKLLCLKILWTQEALSLTLLHLAYLILLDEQDAVNSYVLKMVPTHNESLLLTEKPMWGAPFPTTAFTRNKFYRHVCCRWLCCCPYLDC